MFQRIHWFVNVHVNPIGCNTTNHFYRKKINFSPCATFGNLNGIHFSFLQFTRMDCPWCLNGLVSQACNFTNIQKIWQNLLPHRPLIKQHFFFVHFQSGAYFLKNKMIEIKGIHGGKKRIKNELRCGVVSTRFSRLCLSTFNNHMHMINKNIHFYMKSSNLNICLHKTANKMQSHTSKYCSHAGAYDYIKCTINEGKRVS